MSRRRRTSDLEEVVDGLSWLFSLVPPWICIPIAIVGLFLIPALMNSSLKPAPGIEAFQLIGWMFGAIWALVWLAGGFGGWLKRRQQAAFLRQNIDIKWLNSLSWQNLERQIAEVYRQQGYEVEETGGGGSDGGVDMILVRNGEKTFVQCKQRRSWKVGVKPVRELCGVMSAEGATRGILITSGLFTSEALRFAVGKPLQLIDGAQCAQMVRQFQHAVGGPTEILRQTQNDSEGGSEHPSHPVCPVCGSSMVLRRAKRGAYAGKEFWGCSQYPKCKGIVNLDRD
jgi:restriction system protein